MKAEKSDLSAKPKDYRWAIRPLVPREVYTDREEELEYLYNAAIDAVGRRTMSTVLLGQRRMGKTEIFKRKVLYYSALEEGDRLDLDRIQKELAEREGKVVPMETIRDVLIKLSRGDLLQYMELGGWFRTKQDHSRYILS